MNRLLLAAAVAFAAAPAAADDLSDAYSGAQGVAGKAAFSSFGMCAVPAAMGVSPQFTRISVGDAAADFTVNDMAGRRISMAALRGRVVLLDFWATWCPPCRASGPFLQALHERLGAQGLTIIALNQAEDIPTVRDYVAEHRYTYRVARDEDRSIAGRYNVEGYPTFVVIGKNGREVWRGAGFQPSTGAAMTRAIETALR